MRNLPTRLCRCLAGFIPVVFLGVGCATESDPQLTLRSLQRGQTFTEQFATAYMTRDANGDIDMVLVDRATLDSIDGMAADAPVRQVMHIRMLWNPARDLKADHNSASNATIHWYVLGNRSASSADVLEYAGTGFVVLENSGNGVELSVRSASIEPVARRGELYDPVGASTLQGKLYATDSRQRVRQVLTSVRAAIASANVAASPQTARPASPESPSSLAR